MIGYEGAPRYARLIEALTGDSEIVPPGILLEVDRPEYAILKRERLWAAAFNLAALAANFNFFALVGGLDQLTVITHVWSDNGSRCGLLTQTGMLTGPGANGGTQFRDARRAGKPAVQQFNKQQAGQQFTGAKFFWTINANQFLEIPEFVLGAPGPTNGLLFCVESLVVNVSQTVLVAGYEREARKEEIEM